MEESKGNNTGKFVFTYFLIFFLIALVLAMTYFGYHEINDLYKQVKQMNKTIDEMSERIVRIDQTMQNNELKAAEEERQRALKEEQERALAEAQAKEEENKESKETPRINREFEEFYRDNVQGTINTFGKGYELLLGDVSGDSYYFYDVQSGTYALVSGDVVGADIKYQAADQGAVLAYGIQKALEDLEFLSVDAESKERALNTFLKEATLNVAYGEELLMGTASKVRYYIGEYFYVNKKMYNLYELQGQVRLNDDGSIDKIYFDTNGFDKTSGMSGLLSFNGSGFVEMQIDLDMNSRLLKEFGGLMEY